MRLLVLLLAAAAAITWPASAGGGPHRLAALAARSGQLPPETATFAPRGRRWLLSVLVGLALAVVWSGRIGLVAGLLGGAGVSRLLARADSAADGRRARERAEALPGALDLVGVCLRAGLPVGLALAQVAAVVEGPLNDDLRLVCALHDLGADARSAWSELASDPVLAPVARAMARAGSSGSALTGALAAVAEQSRGQLHEAVEVTARRVGVLVLAPLGLCFLPAFICLGVVPTILGVAGTVLG